jgi:hypothetical protein
MPFDHGLASEFKQTIDAIRYCLRIRNKYAHAYWHDPNQGALCYLSLEELAREDVFIKDLTSLTFYFIDEPLLRDQEAFFGYAGELLTYINYEVQLRAKNISYNQYRMPPTMTPPPFYVRKS